MSGLRTVLAATASIVAASAAWAADGAARMTSPLLKEPVQTQSGLVSGVSGRVSAVAAFKGIPFAAPPVGDLRWRPAQPAAAWSGVRRADKFGPVCIQARAPQRTPPNRAVDEADSPPMSEDCLNLNVWTPAASAKAKLPVMVWVYGGAYTEGAGSMPHSRGDFLAAKGVVVVTFNYRLGALGFLAHPELTRESPHGASGNYALSDTLAALRWVRRNIAAFGGDPDNVTLFGESAGSAMTAALVGAPLAKGLFHRAITESGTWMGLNLAPMRTRESAEQETVKVAASLGRTSLAALRAMPAEEAFAKLPRQGMIIDGWIIPEDLTRTFERGAQNPVDVLVGSNKDEGTAFAGFGPPMTVQLWKSTANLRWGKLASTALELYPASTDAEAAGQSARVFADDMAWIMRLFAEKQRAIHRRAYVYRFAHDPPYAPGARSLGACHSCEIPYVFDNLAAPRGFPDGSSPELAAASPIDQKLAQLVSSYWVNFAKSGDPNGPGLPHWPEFEKTAGGPVLEITDAPAVRDALGLPRDSLFRAMYEQLLAK